ncbi:S41 family peptidase [Allorhizobium sp. BGMRC 0089]|uniref:S41 family peptidase n=1 Tax=Allorhizobium sonneratiae TaxID=2934936 RepID=UPI00203460C3|nr:S41 family peptidase [Allorhizobium sonneratiae]MCM2292820.1 S41 family peptidase [Allorhizobium sonneratiae]
MAGIEQRSPLASFRDPDSSERVVIIAEIYHAIRRYFAHAEGLPAGYDFEEQFAAYVKAAMDAPDRRGFSLASMRLFAGLRNGHTRFMDDQLWVNQNEGPMRIQLVEGCWTVVWTRLHELSPGDVIVSIDGRPVADWVAPFYDYVGSSSPASHFEGWHFAEIFPKRFTVLTDDGRQIMLDLDDAVEQQARGRLYPVEVETIHRHDGLMVIRIPAFNDPRYEQAAISALRDATDAKAVLLDLRSNRGGTTPMNLLSAIMTKPYPGTVFSSPMTIAYSDASRDEYEFPQFPITAYRYGPYIAQPKPDAWPGSMAILADAGCASAGEDFVLRFQQGGRGLVLGEPTWGSTGKPYCRRFPELGMSFRVSTKREYFADGRPFEGVGVTPDRAIPLTRKELQTGEDAQLEEAVRILLLA